MENAIIYYGTDGSPLITIHSDYLNPDQLLRIFDTLDTRQQIEQTGQGAIDNIGTAYGEFIETD